MTQIRIMRFGLERKTKAELQNAWKQIAGQNPDPKLKKDQLVEGIKRMLDEDNNRRFLEANAPRKPISLCEITASEVNDWLRTLPREDAA